MGVSISLCMIVKNEAACLSACLDTAAGIADEIIIADTGSTDNTVEIARRYTDKIFYFDWIDDFSAARNFSFSNGGKDYLMWLDADDIITPENREKFIALKRGLPDVDAVTMPYHCAHDANGGVTHITTRERLLKRTRNFQWEGAVHERVVFSGVVYESDIFITHNKNILDKTIREASLKRNQQIIKNVVLSGRYTKRELYYYALSLCGDGPPDEALEYLHRFFDSRESMSFEGVDAYIWAHRIYLKKGDSAAALKVLGDNEYRLNNKSEFYCALGDYYGQVEHDADRAGACFHKALDCDGTEPSGYYTNIGGEYYYYIPHKRLGEIYFNKNAYREALAHYKKALEYRPDDKTVAEIVGLLGKVTK